MEADSFFSRWEKRNAEKREADAVLEQEQRQAAEQARAEEAARPAPTLEDVAQLTPDSDFKPFVARGVDENVRRSAMKKLFADPQFNVMDGLDIYIDDYNKFEPLPASMLASLNHAQALLDPLKHLQHPVMRLIDTLAAAGEKPDGSGDENKDGEEDEQAADAPRQQDMPQEGDDGENTLPPQTEGQQDNDHQV